MVGKWFEALFVNSQGENRCSLRGCLCLNRRFVAVQIFYILGRCLSGFCEFVSMFWFQVQWLTSYRT